MCQSFFAQVFSKLLKYDKRYVVVTNSVIKATATIRISGPRNARLLPTPLNSEHTYTWAC